LLSPWIITPSNFKVRNGYFRFKAFDEVFAEIIFQKSFVANPEIVDSHSGCHFVKIGPVLLKSWPSLTYNDT
jgi:hypothetical protein